jgi:hypothetical protein
MKPEQIFKARNPLMPAALVAIRRAAQQARREARLTHTAVIVSRQGHLVRLEAREVRENAGGYSNVGDDGAEREN